MFWQQIQHMLHMPSSFDDVRVETLHAMYPKSTASWFCLFLFLRDPNPTWGCIRLNQANAPITATKQKIDKY